MKNLRCIIVDDEHLARTLLENFVQKFPGLELVAKCKDPREAMEVMHAEEIDLIYLDIQMPGLTGIEFLQTLPKRPLVIFTTAYSEYAVEGYQLDVVDYLLKPFSFERFAAATNKARDRYELQQKANASASATPVTHEAATSTTPSRDFITVKADHRLHRIQFSDIDYIEGLKAYVSFFVNGKRIVTLESLKRLEELLPSHLFMRIHKSYIVSFSKVKSIEGNQVEVEGKMLPIGKSYKDEVLRKFKGE